MASTRAGVLALAASHAQTVRLTRPSCSFLLPPDMHARAGIEAMECRADVFFEKPIYSGS